MNIGTPLRSDIFNAATRAALASANNLASPVTRMGLALQSRQAHIFAGIDPVEKAARRAAGKRQRQARKAHR
jgi:hypothetical protein